MGEAGASWLYARAAELTRRRGEPLFEKTAKAMTRGLSAARASPDHHVVAGADAPMAIPTGGATAWMWLPPLLP